MYMKLLICNHVLDLNRSESVGEFYEYAWPLLHKSLICLIIILQDKDARAISTKEEFMAAMKLVCEAAKAEAEAAEA